MSVEDQIAARVAELKSEHTLSPARAEGAALALQDAAARGEWPPLEVEIVASSTDAVTVGGDPATVAARIVERLRALRVPVTGEMDQAIQRAVRG